jgi:hypothetical protein
MRIQHRLSAAVALALPEASATSDHIAIVGIPLDSATPPQSLRMQVACMLAQL